MEVLLIFGSWDQEIDSTLNSNSALSPNSWSLLTFFQTFCEQSLISIKFIQIQNSKFNIKAYKLQL